MYKKYLTPLCLIMVVLCCACSHPKEEPFPISSKNAESDFDTLFALAATDSCALAHVRVNKVQTTDALIEKYEVPVTVYTRIDAEVITDYTGQLSPSAIRIYILGDSESFPSREEIEADREYLFRLESWVDENGPIYLISPLESRFYRVHQGNLFIRESTDGAAYQPATSMEEFAARYQSYMDANPPASDALQTHWRAVQDVLLSYDYKNEELDRDFVSGSVDPQKRLSVLQSLLQ